MIIPETLFKKVASLATGVKSDLRAKGRIIPIEDENGIIKFENYSIIKTPDGFYAILRYDKDIVVDRINLPQTAILVANKLALRRYIDHELIAYDSVYGYSSFEDEQCDRIIKSMSKKQDWCRVDTALAKQVDAKVKAAYAKRMILQSYEKLCRVR